MIFPLLILNARPGAGKSEISTFLQNVPLEEREERYHVGPLKILDDFKMLWAWYEEDRILKEHFNRYGLHTDADGYFLHGDLLWHLLIRRLCLEYDKSQRDTSGEQTVVIEFSRGTEHGGYRAAYGHLSSAILSQAACLYIYVSYEESLRKNRRRENPEHPDSVLEHSLSNEKMERLYRGDDWFDFTSSDPDYIDVRGFRLPYVILENEDDVTTQGGDPLALRLENALAWLFKLWQDRLKTSSASA